MGDPFMQAKKVADKVKRLIRPGPKDGSQVNKSAPSACSAHQVKGCRCREIPKYPSAEIEAIGNASPASSDAISLCSVASTVSLSSIALDGMESFERCSGPDHNTKREISLYDKRSMSEQTETQPAEMQATTTHEARSFSFMLGPGRLSTPYNNVPVANRSPRRLPKLDFLQLARESRQEHHSDKVELRDGEEYYLAPGEVGPISNYDFFYSDEYTADPNVERRRSRRNAESSKVNPHFSSNQSGGNIEGRLIDWFQPLSSSFFRAKTGPTKLFLSYSIHHW